MTKEQFAEALPAGWALLAWDTDVLDGPAPYGAPGVTRFPLSIQVSNGIREASGGDPEVVLAIVAQHDAELRARGLQARGVQV